MELMFLYANRHKIVSCIFYLLYLYFLQLLRLISSPRTSSEYVVVITVTGETAPLSLNSSPAKNLPSWI